MPSLARLSSTDDLVPMTEYSGTRPTLPTDVTLVKLKIVGSASGIDISYEQIANYQLGVSETIEDIAQAVLTSPNQFNWHAPIINLPPRSRLSLRNNGPRFFLFYIETGNCRFAVGSYPFRVEAAKASYFYEARCAWMGGGSLEIQRQARLGYDCRVAYFTVYGDRDFDDHGEPFSSEFNLYLDAIATDGSRVPFSVDPDVGYPGGNS